MKRKRIGGIIGGALDVVCKMETSIYRMRFDQTEKGKNRKELRKVIRNFITDYGGLGYIYADYRGKEKSPQFNFSTKTGETVGFYYRDYGFDEVDASAAVDIFERIAEELGGVFNASYDNNSSDCGYSGGSGYIMYPDGKGDAHIVVGGSDFPCSTRKLRSIGVYTQEAWKIQKAQWDKEDAEMYAEKNKYKKV